MSADTHNKNSTTNSPINIKAEIMKFLSQNKGLVAGYLILSLTTPIANIYLPHKYGKIITLLSTNPSISDELKKRIKYVIIIWILVQSLWLGMNALDSVFVPRLRSFVRTMIVDRVIDTYRENYSENELGAIMAEIVRLPDEIDHLFSEIRNNVLPIVYILVFSIGYFAWINPVLGIISAATISLYIGTAVKFASYCKPVWTKMNSCHSELHDGINECLGNLLNIYVGGGEAREKDELVKKEREFAESHKASIRCKGRFRAMLNICYIALFAGINLTSIWLYTRKRISNSDMISVLIVTLEMISKMSNFVASIDKIMHDVTIIDHVQDILNKMAVGGNRRDDDTTTQNKRPLHQSVGSDGSTGIILNNVRYTTPNGYNILKNINLRFGNNEKVALVGEIGSGKSTILNCIMRLLQYEGQIIIDGVDISTLPVDELRSRIIFVPQNPKLFNRSIYDNIAYNNGATRSDVEAAMKYYNISGFDLDKKAGKFGQHLSGGQRQIVYLLRCLFGSGKSIILLDEPTASLDYSTKMQIFGILQDLLRGKTVIMVSHDNEILQFVDRVVNVAEINHARGRNVMFK